MQGPERGRLFKAVTGWLLVPMVADRNALPGASVTAKGYSDDARCQKHERSGFRHCITKFPQFKKKKAAIVSFRIPTAGSD